MSSTPRYNLPLLLLNSNSLQSPILQVTISLYDSAPPAPSPRLVEVHTASDYTARLSGFSADSLNDIVSGLQDRLKTQAEFHQSVESQKSEGPAPGSGSNDCSSPHLNSISSVEQSTKSPVNVYSTPGWHSGIKASRCIHCDAIILRTQTERDWFHSRTFGTYCHNGRGNAAEPYPGDA